MLAIFSRKLASYTATLLASVLQYEDRQQSQQEAFLAAWGARTEERVKGRRLCWYAAIM